MSYGVVASGFANYEGAKVDGASQGGFFVFRGGFSEELGYEWDALWCVSF